MDNTNWQRPITADGELDVRVDDAWQLHHGYVGDIIAIHGQWMVYVCRQHDEWISPNADLKKHAVALLERGGL